MSTTYTDGECYECGVSAYMCDRCGHVVCQGCQEEADGCPVCQVDGEDCVLCIVELDESLAGESEPEPEPEWEREW